MSELPSAFRAHIMACMDPRPVSRREFSDFLRERNAAESTIIFPPGLIVHADEGEGPPVLWMTAEAISPGLWGAVRADYSDSGLWPLLLRSLPGDNEFRPWESGELYLERITPPHRHDPEKVLSSWWKEYTTPSADSLSKEERTAITSPYGKTWPGLAAESSFSKMQADSIANEQVELLLSQDPSMRLGVVAAQRGSDSLAVAGWTGPMNYTNDTGKISAVVRSWEERYGARVVCVGFSDLYLSIATPPANLEQALHISAEHFAFCPDNVWQNSKPSTLTAYAETLIDANLWKFWWD